MNNRRPSFHIEASRPRPPNCLISTFCRSSHDHETIPSPPPIPHHACNNRRYVITSEQKRLRCTSRPPLRRRSLWPLGKRHKKTSRRRTIRAERWQECTGVKQLCGFVLPTLSPLPNLFAVRQEHSLIKLRRNSTLRGRREGPISMVSRPQLR